MESLSRCIYLTYTNAIPNEIIKSINQTNLDFMRRNRPHYKKKSNMVKEISDSGLKVIALTVLMEPLRQMGLNPGLHTATPSGIVSLITYLTGLVV